MTTWDEMKVTMNKRFKPNVYCQRAHIQLTQLKHDNITLEKYTNQFQRLAIHADFKWDDENLAGWYKQRMHPQIFMSLCLNHYLVLNNVIQIAF